MKKLILTVALFCSTSMFAQLSHMRGFKNLGDDSYLLTLKDPVEAIHRYNYVLDMNGMDTTKVYDITKNPIDFGFFKKDPNSDKVIMCFFLKKDGKYDLLFGEIPDENTYFFDVVDENGEVTELKYIKEE
jgi:hypothetical protein